MTIILCITTKNDMNFAVNPFFFKSSNFPFQRMSVAPRFGKQKDPVIGVLCKEFGKTDRVTTKDVR